MAKKGAQLQVDVETEDEWEKLVQRDGLIICDVYSDWCGPCTGMSGNLRKLKLEIGGDTLTVATAKCDNIQCLERFREKSEPTWMFISGGKLIRLMFGANAPRLINMVTEELNKVIKGKVDDTPREGIKFDQLTDEEQQKVDKETRIREEAERVEREAREKAIMEHREDVVANLMEPMKDYMFAMLWPHVQNEGTTLILNTMKEVGFASGGKPSKAQLNEQSIKELFHYVSWEFEELAIDALKEKGVTLLIFNSTSIQDAAMYNDLLEKIYGEMKRPPGNEDSAGDKLKVTKVIEKPPEEVSVHSEEDENEEVVPNTIEIYIPGIYVPPNPKAKTLGMKILFPSLVAKYDLPEPEPIPPHLIVAFDAFKMNEILQLAVEYPSETLQLGFFTSSDPETAQLIAKTPEQYNRVSGKPFDAKLVIKVSKKKSEPLLSYSLLGPTYVSPNTVVGEKESTYFFPDDYTDAEPEIVETVKKKKKKKRDKGSKSSQGSTETLETESSEGVEEEEDEGLEDVMEEEIENEDRDTLDTDDTDFDVLGDYQEPTDLGGLDNPVSESDKATTTVE